MTRYTLVARLAVPVLLLLGPVLPTATTASPQPAMVEGGADILYRPLGQMGKTRQATTAGAASISAAGEVTIANHGVEDQLVARNDGILALRFDPSFAPPYTISKVSFRYQVPNAICDAFHSCVQGTPSAVVGSRIGTTSWVNGFTGAGAAIAPSAAIGVNTQVELAARAGASLASRSQPYGNLTLPEYNPSVATAANITGVKIELIGVTAPLGNVSGSVTANVRSLRSFNVADCATTGGSAVVTTNTPDGFADVLVGMVVTGPGIPSGRTVLTKDSSVQITMNGAANASFVGATLTFSIPTRTKTAQVVTVGQASTNYTFGGPGDTWAWNWLASDFSDANLLIDLVGATSGTASFSVGGVSTTSGSPLITGVAGFTNARVGMTVTGTGIPSGTTVLATNPGNLQVTLSNNATSTGSGRTLTFRRDVAGCNAVAASPTLTTSTPDGFADVVPGMLVAANDGTGILPGTRVLSKAPNNQTVQLTIATSAFINNETINFTFGVTRCAMTSGSAEVYTERPFTGAVAGMGIAAAAGSAGIFPNTTVSSVSADSTQVTLNKNANATGQLQTLTLLDQTLIRVDAIRLTLFYDEAGTLTPTSVTAPSDWESPASVVPPSFEFPADGAFTRARIEPGSVSGAQIYRNFFGDNPDLYGPGKEITGVEIRVVGARRFAGDPTGTLSVRARSRRSGGPSTTQPVPVTGVAGNYVIGGKTDLLGQTWTQDDFTNANFRLDLIGSGGVTNTSFEVDAIFVSIFYVTKGYFRSVRLTGMGADGLPDLSQTSLFLGDYRLARPALVDGAPATETAEIPVGVTVTEPNKTFFLLLQFPSFPASADSFPFIATDRLFTDQGLYATSFVAAPQSIRAFDCATTAGSPTLTTVASAFQSVTPGMFVNGPGIPLNTTVLAVVSGDEVTMSANATATGSRLNVLFDGPVTTSPVLGALAGGALFLDQNLVGSMTCQLSGVAPLNAPSGLGANLRTTQVEFTYRGPPSVRADGQPAPGGYFSAVELLRRDAGGSWTTFADSGGVGAGKISVPSVPAGLQLWAVRSVSVDELRSVPSNVTITGPASVVGYPPIAEDSDEPNGRASEEEATSLTVPATDRPGTVWPAGELDNFWFTARSNEVITATVVPTNLDFRNDMGPVIHVLDKNGDIVKTAAAGPGGTAEVMYTVPLKKNGQVQQSRFFVQVRDWSGSLMDPAATPRVLIPPTYNLSVNVSAPGSVAQLDPGDAPVAALRDPDAFAFANTGANPVRDVANFGFVIPRSATGGVQVKVRVYDIHGRLMSTLVDGNKTPGTHYAAWSGRNANGNRAGSGPYFARIEAGSWSRTVQINLVK